MHRTIALMCSAFVFLVMTALVNAQSTDSADIAKMLEKLKSAKLEFAKLPTAEALATEERNKKNELKIYDDQMPQVQQTLAAFNTKVEKYEDDARKHNERLERHKAKCGTELPYKAPGPQCSAESAVLNKQAEDGHHRKEGLKSEEASFQKKLEGIAWRSGELRSGLAEIERQRKRRAFLERRIVELMTGLRAHCVNPQSLASSEELKNICGNRQFDGDAVRPPCTTPDCLKARLKGLW